MEDSKNLFSLFEHNAFTDRALESRVIVADVLAKFERYPIYLLLFRVSSTDRICFIGLDIIINSDLEMLPTGRFCSVCVFQTGR